jgi:basic amino acid/polyamine antiporter, APA family
VLKWHRIFAALTVNKLRRTLNLWQVAFFVIGVILGAGIYAVIGKAAGQAGNMLWLAFAFSSVTALLSLFAYAELVSMFPSAGGEYAFLKEAAGKKWARLVGTMVAISGVVASATIAIAFAGYFGELVDIPQQVTSLAIIGIIFLVNAWGIKESLVVNIICTLIEAGGLLFVIYTAAPSIPDTAYLERPPGGFNGVLIAAAICFFSFTGFEDAVKLAEETKQPEKNMPRALFIAALIVIAIYVSTAMAVVAALPYQELADSDSPLSVVISQTYGRTGAVVLAIVALFATTNSLLSNMMGASRVLYKMSSESSFSVLGKVHPKRKTPIRGLIVAAGTCACFALIGKVEKVALIANFFVFTSFLLMNGTVIYLRMKQPDLERPFKTPFTIEKVPVISVLAILMIVILLVYTVVALQTGVQTGKG